jgi:hypothetical protein
VTTPASKVVDSWALLAWLRDEKPAAHVHNVLQQAEAGDIHGDIQLFLTRLPSLQIRLVKPDEVAIIDKDRTSPVF